MTNAELRVSLINMTKLMIAKDHVFNNHFVAQAKLEIGHNIMLVLSYLELGTS